MCQSTGVWAPSNPCERESDFFLIKVSYLGERLGFLNSFFHISYLKLWIAVILTSQKMASFSWRTQKTHTLAIKARSSWCAVQRTTRWKETVIIGAFLLHIHLSGLNQAKFSDLLFPLFDLSDKYTCSAGGKWVSSSGTSQMPTCTPGTTSNTFLTFYAILIYVFGL